MVPQRAKSRQVGEQFTPISLGFMGFIIYIYIYSFHGDYKPTNITGGYHLVCLMFLEHVFFYRSRTAQTDFKNCPENMVGFQSHGGTLIARWMVYFNLFHGKSQTKIAGWELGVALLLMETSIWFRYEFTSTCRLNELSRVVRQAFSLAMGEPIGIHGILRWF